MNYEYNKLLKFLYFEGYADSYEDAEYLLEDLNDDELEELLDVYEGRDLSSQTTKIRPGAIAGGKDSVFKGLGPGTLPDPNSEEEKAKSERRKQRGKISFEVREDFILEYLINEGYTDNYDSAIAIYESMSDEWMDSIINEEFRDLTPEKKARVKDRVGELARGIEINAARMKELENKPFGKFRPKVNQEKEAIRSSVRKKAKLVGNASDALIRTSVSREAKGRKRAEDLKQQLRDLGEKP